ncbi:MAG: hypothetical protein WDZ91_06800 [Paenibacillaceae bacterium]
MTTAGEISFFEPVTRTENVTLHGYIDNLIDNEDGKFDSMGSCWFTVPHEWLEGQLLKDGSNETVEQFLNSYTYDDTDGFLKLAIKEGVLIGCGAGQMVELREEELGVSKVQAIITIIGNHAVSHEAYTPFMPVVVHLNNLMFTYGTIDEFKAMVTDIEKLCGRSLMLEDFCALGERTVSEFIHFVQRGEWEK